MIAGNRNPLAIARLALAVGFVVALIGTGYGCAAQPDPEPIVYAISLVAHEGINPNRSGRPSPVTLQLLILRDVDAFAAAALTELEREPRAALADDLLGDPIVIAMAPQSAQTLALEPPAGARFVGVVGHLYATESASKCVVGLNEARRNIELVIAARGLEIAGQINGGTLLCRTGVE